MNEFKPHDYFKADDQGYISRKVFIEHVRKTYDHMRELATLIKGYDETIDSYLERWDQNLESLDDSIIVLLKEWIDDSTFATIINEEIFKIKADQVDLENVTAQLQQTEQSLNAQLAQKATKKELNTTNQSIANFNDRVDNIIATPTTVSEQEIIDARQNETSLGANLTSIRDEAQLLYDGEYNGGHLEAGNVWIKYKVIAGHKYYIQKTSSGGGIVVSTVNTNGSYDYIDRVNNGSPISTTTKYLFTPTSDASYFVVYASTPATWKIWDVNDITLLNANVLSNTGNITTLQDGVSGIDSNVSSLKNADIKNFSEMLKLVLSTSNKTQYVEIPFLWERGGIFADTGLDWEGGYLAARSLYYSMPCDVTFYMKQLVAGNACTLIEYDVNMQYIRAFSVPESGETYTLSKDHYYRFYVYSNSTPIPIDGGASDYFLIQMVNPLFEGLPSYYTKAWLDDAVERVRDGIAVETGGAFAFVTDMHMTHNSRLAQYLIEHVANETGLGMTICGGDIPMAFVEVGGKLSDDARENVEISISQYNAFESHLRSIGQDVFYCKGNHDFNIVTSSTNLDTGWTMPDRWEHQQIMGKNTRKVHGVSGKNYYYIDDDTEKIRYVVIDQWEGNLATDINNTIPYGSGHYGITVEQYDWLANTAFNVDGYTIVIICHASPDPADYLSITTTNVSEGLFRLIKALKNKTVDTFTENDVVMYNVDYSSSTSELACVISGHAHKSFHRLTENVLTIVTSGDTYSSTEAGVDRTRGTVNENAIDVFGIDTTAKTIKAIRIGGGSDRQWSY